MFAKTNWPVASVVAVRSRPLTCVDQMNSRAGNHGPEGSVTVPRTAPELLPSAVAWSAARIKTRTGKMLKLRRV